MKYLITGGSGFIGGHIVKMLTQNGDQVVVYDIKPDEKRLAKLIGNQNYSNISIINGDITELSHLIKICKDREIDNIIHTAAILDSINPNLTVRVNCDGAVNILEAARIAGVKRVVMASSVSVFGGQDKYKEEFIPNDAPHFPTTLYGATKSLSEACANHYIKTYSLDVIVVRFTHVYGVGRSSGIGTQIDEELFIKPALGKAGVVPNGEAVHNWIYVEDAARSLVMASKVTKTENKIFTAGGDVRSVAEVADYVRSLIPNANITLLPGQFRLAFKFDTALIRNELGYEPQWTIEKGVKNIIDQTVNNK